jgi:hypothetical protein
MNNKQIEALGEAIGMVQKARGHAIAIDFAWEKMRRVEKYLQAQLSEVMEAYLVEPTEVEVEGFHFRCGTCFVPFVWDIELDRADQYCQKHG